MKKLLLATGLVAVAIAALPSSASAVPGYYCEASVVRSLLTGEPLVANRPPVRPCEDDVAELASLGIPPGPAPLASLTLLQAYTNDFPRRPTPTSATPDPVNPADPKTDGAVARAKIASIGGAIPGLLISATGVNAQVDTTCAGGPARPVNTGSGGIATLAINGIPQVIGGQTNQVIPLPTLGFMTINYESEVGTGLTFLSPKLKTRRAISIDLVTNDPVSFPLGAALAPIVGTNVTFAEAISGFEGVANPCDIPIPPGA